MLQAKNFSEVGFARNLNEGLRILARYVDKISLFGSALMWTWIVLRDQITKLNTDAAARNIQDYSNIKANKRPQMAPKNTARIVFGKITPKTSSATAAIMLLCN